MMLAILAETAEKTGGPTARHVHTAVWTGSEVIVWGGKEEENYTYHDGGRYNPAQDSWATASTPGAPTEREDYIAVWTGNEMIIWGDSKGTKYFNDIFSYTPCYVMVLYQRP